MTEPTARKLGKYEIIEEIGKGGFATVYRARDPDLDRTVALKVLDPLLTRDAVWVARFRREARAVAKLDHPHVVTIYEVGQAEGMLYIATRLVEGGSLSQRIAQQGPFPWDDVVRLVSEIAQSLDYAHSQGVVHRDLKAANVLLDEERGALLTDFGFARMVAESSFSVSISGGVVGTPQYIAPEVWEGHPATAQTDVYALGCIVYEMVVGEHLFQGDTTPAVMRAHFKPLELPETWPEGAPPGLEEVLGTALAKEPEARYARAGELAEAVAMLQADLLAEPYAELEAAVAVEDWEKAIALAGKIRQKDRRYRAVADLEGVALAGLDRAARAREATTWRAEAERALAEGDHQGAEMAARQWQGLTPDDPGLQAFLARLERRTAPPTKTPPPTPKPISQASPSKRPAATARSSTRPATAPSRPQVSRTAPTRTSPRTGISTWVWVAGALVLLVLAAIGINAIAGGRHTPEPTEAPVAMPEPTQAPEPTEAPAVPTQAPEPTEAPAVPESTEAPVMPEPTEAPAVPEPTQETEPTKARTSPLAGTVTLWHAWREEESVGLNEVIAVFREKYPDVQFDVLYVPYEDLYGNYETAAAAGDGPSLLIAASDYGPAFYNAGLIADVASYIDTPFLAPINEAALGSVQYKGALIGLPQFIDGVVMYRNTALIADAPTTFDDLVAVAQAATAGDVVGANLEYGFFFAAAHLNGVGGLLMDDSGNPRFNDEKGVEWLNLLNSFKDAGPTEYYTENDMNLFMAGRAGIIIDGTWNMGRLADAIGADNLAIDPWPTPMSGYVLPENIYLSANAEGDDQLAAWKFMEFCLSSEAQSVLADVGLIPAVVDVPVSDSLMQQAMAAFDGGTAFRVIPEMGAYWGPMDTALMSVLDEGDDPSVALDAAYESIVAAIVEIREE